MHWLAAPIALSVALALPEVAAQAGAILPAAHGAAESSPWVRKPPDPKPPDRPKPRPGRSYYHYVPWGYYDWDESYRDDRYDGSPPPDPAPPEPVPPDTAAPVEPLLPPDPQGPFSGSLARGIAPRPPAWQVGEPLPHGLPHVTLDWRQYDLPEPGPGRLYARVGRDVLVITAADRVVEEVLPRE